jgi:hypothetical protein
LRVCVLGKTASEEMSYEDDETCAYEPNAHVE